MLAKEVGGRLSLVSKLVFVFIVFYISHVIIHPFYKPFWLEQNPKDPNPKDPNPKDF